MRIVIIGRNGQLAQALARRAPADAQVSLMGREACDLAAPESVVATLAAVKPDIVINAAAYTAVDKAESDIEAAFRINRDASGVLAAYCASASAPLVHVSTDYVFDGTKGAPYLEDDARNPTGIYGRSKAEGEDAILATSADAAILRTSWVYSAHGANFVKTMLRLAETRDELGVVADQHGRPTAADDLADACYAAGRALLARQNGARGIFHYSGAGDATWADFAEAVFTAARERKRKGADVKRIATAEYPTPAKRPADTRLDTSKIERVLGVTPRPWRAALNDCMDELCR